MTILYANSPSAGALWALAVLIAKATAAVAAGGAASLMLHRSAASVRHWCWFLGLCAMLAVSALSLLLPAWRVLPTKVVPIATRVAPLPAEPVVAPAPPSQAPPIKAATSSAEINRPKEKAATVTPISQVWEIHPIEQTKTPHDAKRESRHFVNWPTMILAVWLMGAVIAFLPTVIATQKLWRLQRRSVRLLCDDWQDLLTSAGEALGLRRRVDLLQTHTARMPMTWGILRPKIVVGADASAWPRRRRRAVLLHELAHIRRRDCLTDMLGRLICCIYWFHPLAWVALARMRDLRERACDDMVLSSGQDAARYARHLLRVAATTRSAGFAACGIPMARGQHLHGRLKAILDERKNRHPIGRRGALVSATVALLAAFPLAMLRAADPTTMPATTSTAQLEGEVRTIEGRLVANAEVALIEPRTVETANGQEFVGMNILVAARSDARGQFHMPMPDLANRPKRRGWDIRATAEGLAYGLSYIEISDGHVSYFDVSRQMSSERASIMLAPAARMIGSVVDQRGNPVPGARVLSNHGTDSLLTDTNGRFVLDKIPLAPSRTLSFYDYITIKDPDFVEYHARADEIVNASENQIRFVLQRGVLVKGTIADVDTGKPLKGFNVNADADRNDALASLSARSDEQGKYQLRVPAGHINLRPDPPVLPDTPDSNYYPELDVWSLPLLEDKSPYTVDFKFHHAQTISGKIAGVEAHSIVALSLYLMPTDPQWVRDRTNHHSASFKPDGTFTISRMKPGWYELTVRGRAYDAPLLKQYITVQEGKDITDLTLTLAPNLPNPALDGTFEVRGNVSYADGTPAANAYVTIYPDRGEHIIGSRTFTLPDGSFVLRHVHNEFVYTIWARDPSGTQGAAVVARGGLEIRKPISLVLQSGADYSGTVRDAAGKGLADYTVVIYETTHDDGRRPLIETLTDQQGHYTLKGFVAPREPGQYSLESFPHVMSTRRSTYYEGYQNLDVRPQKHEGMDFVVEDGWNGRAVEKK